VEIGLFDGVRTGLVRVVTDKGIFCRWFSKPYW